MASQNVCVSSQYNIFVKPESFAHQYEVLIDFLPVAAERRPCPLTKGGNEFQKARCRHVLKSFAPLDGVAYAYDGQAALWTSSVLVGVVENVPFQMDDFMRNSLGGDGEIKVTLTFTRTVNLGDVSIYKEQTPDAAEDRTLRNVLEMILSQNAIERDTQQFASIGAGLLCETRETDFEPALIVRNGNNKGTHMARGPHGLVTREGNSRGVHVIGTENGPQLIMSLEYSNKLFYPSGQRPLLEVLQQLNNNTGLFFNECEKLFSGVKLSLTYNPGRIITFDKFTKENISELRINNDMSMEAFFEGQWGIKLTILDTKAVVAKNNCGIFPIELLTIVDNQSVPTDRLPERLQSEALELNRLKTNIRYKKIMEQHKAMKFNSDDSVCKAFGVEVASEMISGPFSRLPPSVVLVRNEQQLVVDDKGSFRFFKNQYLIPAHVEKLVVLAARYDERKSMDCIGFISKEATEKGMVIDKMMYQEFNTKSRDIEYWLKCFQSLKDSFVILMDSTNDSHSLLKLAGVVNEVSTQHVQWDTAKLVSTGGRPQTRENIVHQLNIKSGGLNHKVVFDSDIKNLNLDNENIMVVGLDVCHPTGGNYRGETVVPSVVGITSNYLDNPNSFGGTFFYQKSRQESVDSEFLQLSIKEMLERNPRSKKIDTIVVMRDGVSEGQYAMILGGEIEAIQKGASAFFGHSNTRIVCIVVTKNGNARHFNISNNHPTSLDPRSVVCFGCRYNLTQFYLVPHRAFQGTAKAVMCTILKDDLNCSTIELQKFILALTNLHQIFCAPVSLPEPIYQADSLAQRGYEVFSCLKLYSENRIPKDENGSIKLRELSKSYGFNFSVPQ